MGTPRCSRPQPATGNGVTDGRYNWPVAPPPSWPVPSKLRVLHGVNSAYKSQDLLHQPGLERASTGMTDQPTTCAATQGIMHRFTSVWQHKTVFAGISVIIGGKIAQPSHRLSAHNGGQLAQPSHRLTAHNGGQLVQPTMGDNSFSLHWWASRSLSAHNCGKMIITSVGHGFGRPINFNIPIKIARDLPCEWGYN